MPLRSRHAVQEVMWRVNIHSYPNSPIATLAMWESGDTPIRRLNFSQTLQKPVQVDDARYWAGVVAGLIEDRLLAMWGASDELPLGDF